MTQPYDPNQPPQYGAPPPPPPPPYGAPPPPAAYGAPPPPAPYGAPAPGYGGYDYGPPPGKRVNDPAPMGLRLLARIIDGLLISVIATAVAYAVGLDPFDFSTDNGSASGSFSLYGADYWKFVAIQLVVSGIYEVSMLSRKGATLGKMAVGVRVAKIDDGTNPDGQAAFLRWVIPAGAQAIIPIFGWIVNLSPFFDSTHRNRGWYDQAAKTIAVRTK